MTADPLGAEQRASSCPTVCAGERLDAALARLLGLSRTRVADLVADGHVSWTTGPRRSPTGWRRGHSLEVTIPRQREAAVVPEIVEDLTDRARRRRHRGRRQAGRRRRAPQRRLDRSDGGRSPGRCRLPDQHQWRAGASGHRPAARRRHERPDGRGEVRARLHPAEEGIPSPHVDKTYHALVQGHPDPLDRDHRRADRPPPEARLQVRRDGDGRDTASRTTRPSRRTASRVCSRSSSRPAARTRSGCT